MYKYLLLEADGYPFWMEYLSCEDCMMLQWGELKKKNQERLPFIVDKNKLKICVANVFALTVRKEPITIKFIYFPIVLF